MEEPEKLSKDLIGAAGVHFVAYRLSLRGLIALPTIRNTAGIDLLVSDPTTSTEAALQVKASLKKVDFWPTSKPERGLCSARSYYVFLRYISNQKRFQAFLERADVVAQQILANAEDYVARGRKEFSFWRLPKSTVEEERLEAAWERWRPPAIR